MNIGFGGALTLLFIALKLTNVIAWSWFWVLSPILIPLIIIGVPLLIASACYLLAFIIDICSNK